MARRGRQKSALENYVDRYMRGVRKDGEVYTHTCTLAFTHSSLARIGSMARLAQLAQVAHLPKVASAALPLHASLSSNYLFPRVIRYARAALYIRRASRCLCERHAKKMKIFEIIFPPIAITVSSAVVKEPDVAINMSRFDPTLGPTYTCIYAH